MESFMEAAKAQNWAVEPQGKEMTAIPFYLGVLGLILRPKY
jgi:hypothetical protein